MARFGLPTVLGASAAGAYGMSQFQESGMAGVWSMLPGSNWKPTPGSSGEVSALQNELRRLTGMVKDMSQQRPTVVTVGSGRSSWTFLVTPVLVGGTVLYIYCRITGTSVFDMFYVSRSSLAQFRTTIQEGMGKMWEEMKRQKEEIFKVVTNLGHKQDKLQSSQAELMVKQDQMDERLRRVDETTYQLDSKANMTIDRVEKLDNRLQDVHTGVQAANQGIYMLVSAVSEVTQKIGLHNSRTAQALHRYVTNGPAWSSHAALPEPAAVAADLSSAQSAPPLAQLPAGPAVSSPSTSAAVGVATGVATPGGLRGLMGSAGSARLPDTAAGASAATAAPHARGNGLSSFTAPATASSNGVATANGNGCHIEELTENGRMSGAAPAAKATAAAGLGVLRL